MIIANQFWRFGKQLVAVLSVISMSPFFPGSTVGRLPFVDLKRFGLQPGLNYNCKNNYKYHQMENKVFAWRSWIIVITSNEGRKHCWGANTVFLKSSIFMGNEWNQLAEHLYGLVTWFWGHKVC